MSFFYFPNEKELERNWAAFLVSCGGAVQPNSRLCGAHFTQKPSVGFAKWLRLLPGALPSFPTQTAADMETKVSIAVTYMVCVNTPFRCVSYNVSNVLITHLRSLHTRGGNITFILNTKVNARFYINSEVPWSDNAAD